MRRIAIVLALVCFATGCHSWRPVPVTPASIIEERPALMRVTHTDGTRTMLSNPLILSNAVIGTSELGEFMRISTPDVRQVEIQALSRTRTTGLLVAHVSTIISLVALIIHVQPHYRGAF